MKDRLPLCRSVGFLETDSEMEFLCKQFLWGVLQEIIPARDRGKQSWAEGEVGVSRPLRQCWSWMVLQSCHKLDIRSGFIIPSHLAHSLYYWADLMA